MSVKNKLVNVGSWWRPGDVEKLDRVREGTYLSRSVFIKKTVLDHISQMEQKAGKMEQGNEI